MGKNFSATLMETVFLNSGIVMERKIVKTAVMKSTVMELYVHVMREQNFLARPQVPRSEIYTEYAFYYMNYSYVS